MNEEQQEADMTRTFNPDTTTIRCERCDKDVVMKSHEVGKFWWLKEVFQQVTQKIRK